MPPIGLIILAAVSIILNIVLFSFCTRTLHWANYWKSQYQDAVAAIEPVDPYSELKLSYDWKEDWD